jgi:hypothetical protein
MGDNHVLRHLTEAAEHLERAIEAMRDGNEIGFEAWLVFVYRKLNFAWNSRNLTTAANLSGPEFEKLCRFPMELHEDIAD